MPLILYRCPHCKHSGLTAEQLRLHQCEAMPLDWHDRHLRLPEELFKQAIEAGPDTSIWGYEVKIEILKTMLTTEEKSFHKQGSESAVRRWAKLKRGYVRIIEMVPLTRSQWIAA